MTGAGCTRTILGHSSHVSRSHYPSPCTPSPDTAPSLLMGAVIVEGWPDRGRGMAAGQKGESKKIACVIHRLRLSGEKRCYTRSVTRSLYGEGCSLAVPSALASNIGGKAASV